MDQALAAMPAHPPVCVDPPDRIGIELPSGVRPSVNAAVDADAVSRVLGVLGR